MRSGNTSSVWMRPRKLDDIQLCSICLEVVALYRLETSINYFYRGHRQEQKQQEQLFYYNLLGSLHLEADSEYEDYIQNLS